MDSSMEAFEDHDVAAKALVRQGGVGVSWNMSPRYSVETDYLWTISGSNTHAAKSVTMSFSRNFSTPRR
jgi:hypothetical protein